MTERLPWRRLAALVAVLALMAGACSDEKTDSPAAGSDDSVAEDAAQPATGEPIVFGNLSVLTGTIALPQGGEAVQAYFDDWNARGGYEGRPLQLLVEDSQLDPAVGVAAASKLIEQDGVLGMVGNTFLFDCAVNGEAYRQQSVPSIVLGIDQSCFENEIIFPVSPGPTNMFEMPIQYLLDEGRSSIYFAGLSIPATELQIADIESYLAANGDGAELVGSSSLPFGPAGGPTAADIDGFLADVASSGADAVAVSIDQDSLATALERAEANGIGTDDVTWIAASGVYNPSYIDLFGQPGEGLNIFDSFDPFQSEDEGTQEVAAIFEENDITPDAFAAAGWVAASVLEQAMAEVQGELTRESLAAALASLDSVQAPLVLDPFDFTDPAQPSADDPRVNSASGKVVAIEDGEFVLVTEDWIVPVGS